MLKRALVVIATSHAGLTFPGHNADLVATQNNKSAMNMRASLILRTTISFLDGLLAKRVVACIFFSLHFGSCHSACR